MASHEAPPQHDDTIDLKILSPSDELHGELRFKALPVTTTIAELKNKIRDAVDTRPSNARQRLIFRGRVRTTETDTILDILGRDAIDQSREQVFHLVLREPSPAAPSHASSASTSRPFTPLNHARPVSPYTLGTLPRMPEPVPTPLSRPHSPTRSNPPLMANGHHAHVAPSALTNNSPSFPAFPLPPDMVVNMLNQHMASVNRGNALPGGNNSFGSPPPSVPMDSTAGVVVATNIRDSRLESLPEHAHVEISPHAGGANARSDAATGESGSRLGPHNDASVPRANINARMMHLGMPPAAQLPNTSSTYTQSGVHANGQRWTMTVNSSTMTLPTHGYPNGQLPHISGQHTGAFTRPASVHPNSAPSSVPEYQLPAHQEANSLITPNHTHHNQSVHHLTIHDLPEIRSMHLNLQGMRQDTADMRLRLSHLRGALGDSEGSVESRVERWTTQVLDLFPPVRSLSRRLDRYLDDLASLIMQPIPSEVRDISGWHAGTRELLSQGRGLLKDIDELYLACSELLSLVTNDPHSLSQPQQNSTVYALAAASSTTPEIYLLSSPSGPRALIVGPDATYTTPSLPPNLHYRLFHSSIPPLISTSQRGSPLHTEDLLGSSAANSRGSGDPPPTAARLTEAPVAPVAPDQQNQPQDQNQNQNQNDLRNILLPAAGHIWLVLRLLGFIYFFSGGGGGGWWRPILVASIAAVIYLVQTGEMFQDLRMRLHRHFGDLILEDDADGRRRLEDERPAQGAAAAENLNADATRARDDEPRNEGLPALTPEAVAHRVGWRDRQNRTWARQQLYLVERAVALFFASLWPGVGERVVRAREEARAEQDRLAAANAPAEPLEQPGDQAIAPAAETSVDDEAGVPERAGHSSAVGEDRADAESVTRRRIDKGKGRAVETEGDGGMSSALDATAGSSNSSASSGG